MSEDLPATAAQKAFAVAGLRASVIGLNAAAYRYSQVFGKWPRLDASVARVILTPLDGFEVNQVLDVAVFDAVVTPGHG